MKQAASLRLLIALIPLLALSTAAPLAAERLPARKKVVTGPADQKVTVSLHRQLVYGLTLFDGGEYQGTFCPREIGPIYLLAEAANVVTASRTDVYFWPITREYKADWLEVNEKQRGTLEVLKGRTVIRSVRLEKYTFLYPDGYAGQAKQLIVGKRAQDAAKEFQVRTNAFYDQVLAYYRDCARYDKLTEEYLKNAKAFGNRPPKPPAKPLPPAEYIPDTGEGFILNLHPGRYRIRLRGEDGRVVPGSIRELVAFPVLAKGIGYEVIPEEKWTYPTKSDDRSENLFAQRNQVLYLRPLRSLQLNSHHYLKLSQLPSPASGRGMENQKTWVHISPIGGGNLVLQILRDGKVISRIEEKLYYVRQRPGYTLGYDIVEFRVEEYPGATPSFAGYQVRMPDGHGQYSLRLVQRSGKVLASSRRNVRTVRQPGLLVLMAASLIPLVAGVSIIAGRAFITRKE